MKKIFFIGFNTGSGIEYTGKMFLKMLQGEYDVYEYQHQNPAFLIIDDIIKYEPDIIILNEHFTRSIEAAYFYKRMNKKVKLVHLLHDWNVINEIYKEEPPRSDPVCISHYYYNRANAIFLLNTEEENQQWSKNFINKNLVPVGYFPVDSNEYKIKTPWNQRKDFCVISTITPNRISTDFLNEIKNHPNIKIDCYGTRIEESYTEYYQLFDSIENLTYNGLIKQDNVSDVLNQYKYLILAHNEQTEIFYVTLLQAILCGTIPLISNNRMSDIKNYKWIDWADGLYFGCNTEKELVSNIQHIIDTDPDNTLISTQISKIAKQKFSFDRLKKKFLDVLKLIS